MNKFLIILILLLFHQAEGQNSSALAIGDSLYNLGDYTKAILSYKIASESEAQLFKLAKSYEALGYFSEAQKCYTLLNEKFPKAVEATYNYGKLLTLMGKDKEAVNIFEQLSDENPQNPNFYYQLGLVQEKLNDSLALINFQTAYQLDTNHFNALYKIAKRKVEKRNFSEAKILINKALNVQSTSERFLMLDALVNFHTENYHAAIISFKKLADQNYSSVQFHEVFAKSYIQTNQFEEAIDQYTILINKFNDQNAGWHFEIGRCFMALRYLEKAERHLNIAIALQEIPLDTEYVTLSQLYNRRKDYKNEMFALEKALLENPLNELAQYQLAVAADNYFEDKQTVLRYYNVYLNKHGETGRRRELAKHRVRDIKKELHFTKN